jgi:N-acetylmuramoyl-L-alanine amidase
MKILIDTGHTLGVADTGAQGNGRKEEVCTREIGNRLKPMLEGLGHLVVMVAPDHASTLNESLASRVNKANSDGGDIYVSIHLNAGGGKGTEVFTYGGKHFAEADRTISAFCELGFLNRGVKDGSGLYVIRETNMKAMLVECCFIDTDDMNKYNPDNFAKALCKGITGQVAVEKPIFKPVDSWVARLQAAIRADVDNIAGPQTLSLCPLLKFGMNNSIVKLLQEKLGISADGIFGMQTLQAVQGFQRAHSLQQDGIVGQNTWRALLGL